MRALLAVLRIGRPVTPRLALAILAGIGAAASAIGLAATSAWLISKAAQQPPILTLFVAVTSVRAFGIARGVLRYAERLAAHDAAFRVLGELRATVYARLVRLAPAGLAELRSGDLLARLVGDVDGLADLWLRVLLPYGSAMLVATGAVALIAWLAPAAGLAVAAGLVVTAIGAPLAATAVSRRAERLLAPARGDLGDAAIDLLQGAPEILAAGAAATAVDEVRRVDERLAAAERRSALGAGTGGLVAGLAAGASAWIALVLGIIAVREGDLDVVALAVVALTPIAIHEVLAPLVPAAQKLPGLAASAGRVLDILARPDPVPEPEAPLAVPDGPLGIRARALRLRYPRADADALVLPALDVPAGARVVVTGPSGAGKSTLAAACLRFLEPVAGTLELTGTDAAIDVRRFDGDAVRAASACASRTPTSSTPRSPTTSAWRGRARRTPSSRVRSRRLVWSTGSARSPTASRRRWASMARGCRAASGNGWRWPGRCSRTCGSSSSTSRPSTLTSPPRARSSPTSRRPRPVARCSSSRIARSCSTGRRGSGGPRSSGERRWPTGASGRRQEYQNPNRSRRSAHLSAWRWPLSAW